MEAYRDIWETLKWSSKIPSVVSKDSPGIKNWKLSSNKIPRLSRAPCSCISRWCVLSVLSLSSAVIQLEFSFNSQRFFTIVNL